MRKWMLLGVAAGLAILVWSNRPAIVPEIPAPDASAPVAAPVSPEASPSSPAPFAKVTAVPEKSVVDLAPTLEQVRADAEKNPHVTPSAVIGFSADLAPRLESATKSPAAAERFLDELKECLEGKKLSGMKTLQALCLVNLRRLADKVPAVRERAQGVAKRADPEVRRLAE